MWPPATASSKGITWPSRWFWLLMAEALAAAALTGCVVPHAAGPAPGAAGGAAAPAAAPCNLWSFLLPTAEQKTAMRTCFCTCPLGRLLNNMLAPVSLFSGGLLPQICPGPDQPNPADLAKPADSSEGAAARIKQSEADAKARRAAVRYLATVDCRRFPEAEAALINALLADTSECVRLEAAIALGNGCCCTKATVQALMQSVSGKAGDNPPETSPRVRRAAARALERCLARCSDWAHEEPRRPEAPTPPEKPSPAVPGGVPAEPSPTPSAVRQARTDSLINQARRVLAEYHAEQYGGVAEPALLSGAAPEFTPALAEPEVQAIRMPAGAHEAPMPVMQDLDEIAPFPPEPGEEGVPDQPGLPATQRR